MQSPHEVYLSLGSNIGERIYHLHAAVQQLATWSASPLVCSAVYETRPVGPVAQADFLNLVVRFWTHWTPLETLRAMQDIEQRAGRTRDIRFGPRTLDVDILLYDNEYVCFHHLQIPHPRMWERSFVLVPLAQLIPHRHGLGGLSIGKLAELTRQEGDVRDVGRFW